MKVPIAITAVSAGQLAQKGITNSDQLAQAVPNLQVNSAYGDTQPNFTLRGIGVANEYNSNQVSPVGVYVNDVNLVSRTAQGMGLYDLDRVEVLRGPQGTLFGRNTTGGAINFITRQPGLNGNNAYVEAGYGNFNTKTVQAAAEATLVPEQVGLRLAMNYEEGDGKFHNVYPGGLNPGSVNTLSGRGTLRVKSADGNLDIKISGYIGRNLGTQEPIIGSTPYRQGLGFFQVNQNDVGLNTSSGWGTAANITYRLSSTVKLISITSYDGSKQDLSNDSDPTPINLLNTDWQSRYRQFTTENRINYSGDKLNLVAGTFYGWDRIITDNDFQIGNALGPGVDGGFFQHYRQARTSFAVFAQGDYNLTSKLVATLGMRYTWDRAHYDDGYAYLYAGTVGGPRTPLATTVPCTGVPGTCAYDPDARFSLNGGNNALTGRAALSYTFDDGMLVYASYNRGYRSGAFNGGGYTSSAGITYIKPEEVNAYEAGFKGRFFDHRLSIAAAGFFYDYQNQQVQDLQPGPIGFLVNAPKSQVYGAELEATWRVIPALTLNGSVGYLHSEYRQLVLQNTDLAGNQLPFAPSWTLQGGFDWTMAKFAGGDLVLSSLFNYYSHQYFSPYDDINAAGTTQNNYDLQQNGYAKVNASLTWRRDNLQIKAWVDNLTNTKSLAYGLDLRGAGFSYNYLVPANPRTFGGTIRIAIK